MFKSMYNVLSNLSLAAEVTSDTILAATVAANNAIREEAELPPISANLLKRIEEA